MSWLVIILLLSAVLRIYGINNFSPPGLEHDEVANWLIDRAILDGKLALYFQEAYGHEAGFHYLQAAFVALLAQKLRSGGILHLATDWENYAEQMLAVYSDLLAPVEQAEAPRRQHVEKPL